jgi:hypothetical protein
LRRVSAISVSTGVPWIGKKRDQVLGRRQRHDVPMRASSERGSVAGDRVRVVLGQVMVFFRWGPKNRQAFGWRFRDASG